MPLVVADNHYSNGFWMHFVEEVIGKSFEVSSSKPAVRRVKSQRILTSPLDETTQFRVEVVGQFGRDFVLVAEDLQHVAPNERVVVHPHFFRSWSTSCQNFSDGTAWTRPESSSSRRRAASAVLSSSASSPLDGGSESSNQAASLARSLSGRPETDF